MFRLILFIGSGSLVGGILRFLVSRFVQNHFASSFPIGTLVVNVSGCFLMGLFYGLSEKGHLLNNELRMFLTIGIVGGYTTFSTFANENILMLHDKSFLLFALYTGLSVFIGLIAVYLGSVLSKML